MSRTKKEKITPTGSSLQVISENTVEYAVTAADGYNSDSSREKRKKEDNKPIYLKRV